MIRSNLSVLLAERNLRISTVAKETGISRTTLTSLASNSNLGIQLDTINTLCNYLRTEPGKLLQYIPCEVEFELDDAFCDFSTFASDDPDVRRSHTIVGIHVIGRNGPIEYTMLAKVKRNVDNSYIEVSIAFEEPAGENETATERNNRLLQEFMRSVAVPFQEDLSRKLLCAVSLRLASELDMPLESLPINMTWPFARYYEP